jgi:hypothetical protein
MPMKKRKMPINEQEYEPSTTTAPELMPNDESEDDDDDGDEERQTTPEQAARLKDTKELLRQIIADADRLAQATSPGAWLVNVDGPTDTSTPQMEDEFTELVRRVLGDAFHFMDRVKVPITNGRQPFLRPCEKLFLFTTTATRSKWKIFLLEKDRPGKSRFF